MAAVRKSSPAFVLILAILCMPRPAAAYLDPTSGSLLLQIILGGVAGLAVIFKLFWHRLRGWFRPGREEQDPNPNP